MVSGCYECGELNDELICSKCMFPLVLSIDEDGEYRCVMDGCDEFETTPTGP